MRRISTESRRAWRRLAASLVAVGIPALAFVVVATVVAALPAGSSAAVDPVRPSGCPSSADPATFMSTQELYRLDERMANFGPRPTGSPAHKAFIDWLERWMERLPGMRMESVPYQFDRWAATGAGLTLAGGQELRVSSPVPYSQPTGAGGVTAPLAYVPTGTAIGDQDVRGKLVVRDFPPTSIPNAAFTALEWWSYDPDLTLTKTIAGNYTREWLSGQAQADLEAARQAGAAGVIFAHQLPYEQEKGYYAPYSGIRWGIPGLWVGVDEGEALKRAAAAGESATLRLTASQGPDTTRMLIATLPGQSAERLVVGSHTDGMNAVWDNGPISMLALAQHYASLPLRCRPRTLQFVFTTAHLYQSLGGPSGGGSANLEAQQLDNDYNQGTVAAVMTVEHMGARNYEAVPRPGGQPGDTLVATGKSEPNTFFFGESPALSQAVLDAVVKNDLRATIALQGADLPSASIPIHQSFGGEGGSYHDHLVPTIAFVTGSWALFGTGFETDQILDPDLMRQQTLVFADILHNIETIPRDALAGGYLPERAARNVLCTSALSGLGLANCDSGVTSPLADPGWLNTIGRLEMVH